MDFAIFDLINQWDVKSSVFIQNNFSSPLLDSIFLAITDMHKEIWFQLGFAFPLLIVWVWKEGRQGAFKLLGLIVTIMTIDGFCGQIVKKVFARPRPFVLFPEILQKSPASGFSFVSNHTANMVGIAVFLSHYYPRWRILWWGMALLIGWSRIYNGVHFVSDVIVGGLIGGLIACLATRWLDRRLLKTEKL